jgi:sterol desaturase/sphingolipid hydroxylase (fatty acid hydroxylase superfamily)
MERVLAAIEHVVATAGLQLGAVFLAPGSSVSLAALACTFAVFAPLALRTRRKRRLRRGAAWRAMFPARLWKSASSRTDFLFFLLGTLFYGMLFGWAVFSGDYIRGVVGGWLGGPAEQWLPGWASAAVATLVLFVVYEATYYQDHFLMHRVPFLWRFHKVHHQAESLSIMTGYRIHPVEAVGFSNLLALNLGTASALLQWTLGAGVNAWTLGSTNLLIVVLNVTLSNLQHSHLWIGFGPRWGKWFIGPAHHQIHHSTNPAHFNRNFGSVLTVFDRMFGTFHLPAERRERLSFGVDDGETAPHGWRAALFAPFLPAPRPQAQVTPESVLAG